MININMLGRPSALRWEGVIDFWRWIGIGGDQDLRYNH